MKKCSVIVIVLLVFASCSKTKNEISGICPNNPFGISAKIVTLGSNTSTRTITARSDWAIVYNVSTQNKSSVNGDFEIICLDDNCTEENIQSRDHRLKITGDWFEIAEISKKELSISVAKNETGADRSINISLNNRDCNETITVTQKAN